MGRYEMLAPWRVDDKCGASLEQGPPRTEEQQHAAAVRAAEDRKLNDWSKLDVSDPEREGAP